MFEDLLALYQSLVEGEDPCLPGLVAWHLDAVTGVALLVFSEHRKAVRQVRSSAVVDAPGLRMARIDIDAQGNCLQLELHP